MGGGSLENDVLVVGGWLKQFKHWKFNDIWIFMVILMRSALIDSQKGPGFWYYQNSMELNRSN